LKEVAWGDSEYWLKDGGDGARRDVWLCMCERRCHGIDTRVGRRALALWHSREHDPACGSNDAVVPELARDVSEARRKVEDDSSEDSFRKTHDDARGDRFDGHLPSFSRIWPYHGSAVIRRWRLRALGPCAVLIRVQLDFRSQLAPGSCGVR